MEGAAPRKDVKRVCAKCFIKNHVLSPNISDGYAVRFFFANNEERFHRACTNGTLKSIAAVRSNAPNCMLQGSKSDPMHACMHEDCLETRLNMRKTQSAKQICRFRMFIELRELRTK